VADRQLLVAFLTGRGDAAVVDNAEALQEKFLLSQGSNYVKGSTDRILFDANAAPEWNWDALEKLRAALGKLTRWSRVYIVGHGDWRSQCVGDYDGKLVAHLLWNCGMPQIDHITVAACSAARTTADDGTGSTAGSAREGSVRNSSESFTANLHYYLGKSHKLKLPVYGYTFSLSTYKVGDKDAGRKLTTPDSAQVGAHRLPHSKKKYYWKGSKQMWEWVY
jgi:hypothetical protein